METAISLPDETFDRATRRAQERGISRSEFFARAAVRYLDVLETESVTARIDEVLDRIGGRPDESADAAVSAGRASVAAANGEW